VSNCSSLIKTVTNFKLVAAVELWLFVVIVIADICIYYKCDIISIFVDVRFCCIYMKLGLQTWNW